MRVLEYYVEMKHYLTYKNEIIEIKYYHIVSINMWNNKNVISPPFRLRLKVLRISDPNTRHTTSWVLDAFRQY